MDSDERTSMQPLDTASVLVSFRWLDNDVVVLGCYVHADFVDAGCFASEQVLKWRDLIRKECLDEL